MVVLFQQYTEIYAFSPIFPLVGSVIGEFYWLFLWNFKEIKHQPFSMTQPKSIACLRRAFPLFLRQAVWWGVLSASRHDEATAVFLWLCCRKWLMLFSLKRQRDNRENALSVAPALRNACGFAFGVQNALSAAPLKGKTGKKVCIFTALWRWNNHKPEQGLSFLGWTHDWAMLLAISLEL